MSTDTTSSLEPTPHLDTPESARECLDLAILLDEQLTRWVQFSWEKYRGTDTPNLALLMKQDTDPLGHEPIDYTVQTPEDIELKSMNAKEKTEDEQRRATLSRWALLQSLDAIPAHNVPYANYLKSIHVAAQNLRSKPEYSIATERLYRLMIFREQLAEKIGRAATVDLSQFRRIASKLDNDFM